MQPASSRVSLRTLVAAFVAAALLAVALAGALAFGLFRSQLVAGAEVDAQVTPVMYAASSLSFERGAVVGALADYWASPSPSTSGTLLEETGHARLAEKSLQQAASAFLLDSDDRIPGEAELVAQLAEIGHSGQDLDSLISDALDPSTPTKLTFVNSSALSHEYLGSVNRLSGTLAQRVVDASDDLESAARSQQWLIAGLVVLSVLCLLGLYLISSRLLLGPLADLASQLRRASRPSSRASRIRPSGPSELVSLALDAETMRSELVSRIDALEGARAALEDQAPLVSLLRAALTPPASSELVALRSAPAEGVLAGDWLDVASSADARDTWIVVGDVAGHGPAAALTALRVREAMRTAIASGQDPVRVVEAASTVFASPASSRASFVSLLLVRVRKDDALTPVSLDWVNAGHPAAHLASPTASGLFALTSLDVTGPVLSSFSASRPSWTVASLPLLPGSSLLAFTDGVSELRLPADSGWVELGESFSAQFLLGNAAALASGELSPAAASDDLMACLRSMGDAFWGRDDVTFTLALLAP